MAWPGVADFSSAIQNPGQSLADWELTQGELAVYEKGGRTGMPVVSSGNFAAVYRISSQSRSHAVRCFTRAVNDQRDRYTNLDAYLKRTLPPAFVEFQYLEKGIRVAGVWYPLVKMEWVDGLSLDKFVRDNLNSPDTLQVIAARWRGVVNNLQPLAHNDLQHGNVMVQPDRSIRLVDYDAMYLPAYQGQTSPENGHQNFQHPRKTSKNYNESIDNFPSLVIYVSLLAIAADPGLFNKFYNDDNLLFRKADYGDPANSDCFQALKNNPDGTVRQLIAHLEQFCSVPVDDVPKLEDILKDSAPARRPTPAPAAAPPSTGSWYRDQLQGGQQTQTSTQAPPAPAAVPALVATAAPPAQPAAATAVIAMTCPGCGRSNPADLIYCENPKCIAPLQPGRRFCAGCGTQNPPNAVYCPECGQAA